MGRTLIKRSISECYTSAFCLSLVGRPPLDPRRLPPSFSCLPRFFAPPLSRSTRKFLCFLFFFHNLLTAFLTFPPPYARAPAQSPVARPFSSVLLASHTPLRLAQAIIHAARFISLFYLSREGHGVSSPSGERAERKKGCRSLVSFRSFLALGRSHTCVHWNLFRQNPVLDSVNL